MCKVRTRLLNLFLPPRCIACSAKLHADESVLCSSCIAQPRRISISEHIDNEVTRRFWNSCEVRYGNALIKYDQKGRQHRVFEAMKYRGRTDACQAMGVHLAQSLTEAGFLTDIDCIVPIPLSRQRYDKRGYNQAEHIALGISRMTGLPVCTDVLWRKVDNPSQTHLTRFQRIENVKRIFGVHNASTLAHKHILIVDDIITTGATISSAIREMAQHIPDVRFSVASVGLAID